MQPNGGLTLVDSAAQTAALDDEADDSFYGWVLMAGFGFAVLAVCFVICMLALDPSWWMLGALMVVHIALTAVLMKVTFGAFVSPAYPSDRVVDAVPRSQHSRQRPVALTPALLNELGGAA